MLDHDAVLFRCVILDSNVYYVRLMDFCNFNTD